MISHFVCAVQDSEVSRDLCEDFSFDSEVDFEVLTPAGGRVSVFNCLNCNLYRTKVSRFSTEWNLSLLSSAGFWSWIMDRRPRVVETRCSGYGLMASIELVDQTATECQPLFSFLSVAMLTAKGAAQKTFSFQLLLRCLGMKRNSWGIVYQNSRELNQWYQGVGITQNRRDGFLQNILEIIQRRSYSSFGSRNYIQLNF